MNVEEAEYQPVNTSLREPVHVVSRTNRGRDRRSTPSLMLALVKTFGWEFTVAGVYKIFQDLLLFASPQILK